MLSKKQEEFIKNNYSKSNENSKKQELIKKLNKLQKPIKWYAQPTLYMILIMSLTLFCVFSFFYMILQAQVYLGGGFIVEWLSYQDDSSLESFNLNGLEWLPQIIELYNLRNIIILSMTSIGMILNGLILFLTHVSREKKKIKIINVKEELRACE